MSYDEIKLLARIEVLENQLIQAEDIAKEALEDLRRMEDDKLLRQAEAVAVFTKMSFWQRLWWAFTKKVPK